MAKVNPQGRLWSILEETERREIQLALAKHNGNVRKSAEYLGIHHSRLYKRLASLGIDKEAYKDGVAPKFPPPHVVPEPDGQQGSAAEPGVEHPKLTGWLAEAGRGGGE